MARNNVQSTQGQKLYLALGDGATPEVFTRILLMNTNVAPTWTQNIFEDSVADLNNFDNPYDIVREIQSRDFTVEGQGKLDARYLDVIIDLFEGERQGQIVNCKFTFEGPNGFSLTGPFVISSFSIDAVYKETSTCSMSWQKAGELVFTKNVP